MEKQDKIKCKIKMLGKDRLFNYFCSTHNCKFSSAEIKPKICWKISNDNFKRKMKRKKEEMEDFEQETNCQRI